MGQPVDAMADATVNSFIKEVKKMEHVPEDLQKLIQETEKRQAQGTVKQLHSAVHKLEQARKQLVAVRENRFSYHAAWNEFLKDAVERWGQWSLEFKEQETKNAEDLKTATANFQGAKEELASMQEKVTSGTDEKLTEEDDFSDIDMDAAVALGEGIDTMLETLTRMKNKAQTALEEDPQSKRLKTAQGKTPVPGPSAAAVPPSPPLIGGMPSTSPFGGAG